MSICAQRKFKRTSTKKNLALANRLHGPLPQRAVAREPDIETKKEDGGGLFSREWEGSDLKKGEKDWNHPFQPGKKGRLK